MNADIKDQLEKTFPPFELGENRSLLECDFFDTYYCYFDQIDDDFLSQRQMSTEDLFLKINFDWPEFYLQIGLEAAHLRSRPNERIRTWKDVSYEYLYYFGQECYSLSSEGFKFYLPAAIYHFLTTDQNKAFMDSFGFRLNTRWGEDNHVFSDAQKEFIAKFKREHC
ncbi:MULTISPECIES: hypothetical protein [Acinetobacter]|jgi:hypothetical protein|uniref:hypothetical protein n=1 Tax=Acinetobacter TaxID=469 RepID=UPI0022DEA879|nr:MULTISPECIES: hypothetical protein [Acinetobacter]MDI1221677.1 hypothetical protein [Acinetobacter sp.]